ncbi:hypothetical protein TNCV_2383541 [Trichonephila clavipes]|nr:hypothetical protein TNCV_2383541 [Trichonephila clavipes]
MSALVLQAWHKGFVPVGRSGGRVSEVGRGILVVHVRREFVIRGHSRQGEHSMPNVPLNRLLVGGMMWSLMRFVPRNFVNSLKRAASNCRP